MPELGPRLQELIDGSLSPLDVGVIVARRRRHRRQRRIGTALAAAVVITIGIGGALTLRTRPNPTVGVNVTPRTAAPTVSASTGPQRYTIVARVEQDATHGPELCILPTATAGTTRDSSDCAGPKLAHWDWTRVPSPSHASGSTFGWYRLVGTYNGNVFTVTETPVKAAAPRNRTPAFPAPCPTPPGGWHATSSGHLGLVDFQALQALAQGAPDFAGIWMSTTSSSAPVNDFQHTQVTVVAFTGDIPRHRLELAAVWGGPICVVQHRHSYAVLQAVVQRINEAVDHKQLAVQELSIGPDEVDGVVDLQLVAATPATQREIDRRFGAGLVKVSSLMTPVS